MEKQMQEKDQDDDIKVEKREKKIDKEEMEDTAQDFPLGGTLKIKTATSGSSDGKGSKEVAVANNTGKVS